MKLKKNEFIYEGSEFDNFFVLGIQEKENFVNDFLIPDTGRTIAISKKNNKVFEYADEETLNELHLNFGKFIKKLDEDDIDEVLKKIK